jgi:segregation and condensation protein B
MNDESQTGPEEPQEPEKFAPPESLRILEAILFASEEVMTPLRLKSLLPDNPDARVIRKMVDEINRQLQRERHPFEVVELGGGYQFRTIPYYQPWVQQLFKEKAAKKLSIQGLECLAIIAYKQPLSKAEIESIRGVISDGAMKTLLERRLITISGRSDKAGRPLLYTTTPEFLKYFGINKLADLPRIEEFEAMAKEKLEEISDEELEGLGISAQPGEEASPAEGGGAHEQAPESAPGDANQDADIQIDRETSDATTGDGSEDKGESSDPIISEETADNKE